MATGKHPVGFKDKERTKAQTLDFKTKVWEYSGLCNTELLTLESKIYTYNMALNTGAIAYVMIYMSQIKASVTALTILSVATFVLGILYTLHKMIVQKHRVYQQGTDAVTAYFLIEGIIDAIDEGDTAEYMALSDRANKLIAAEHYKPFKAYLDYMPFIMFIIGGTFFLVSVY